MRNIKYLVGNKNFSLKPFEPFSNDVLIFLEKLSKELNLLSNIKLYPDLKSLSFWCRKQNLYKLKEEFLKDKDKIGLGLVFHITPSNVATNFAYSLIFGLLSGNSNVVKVPSKNFTQIKLICGLINKILKKKNNFLKDKITIVRYKDDDQSTRYFSMISDARLIWGGDKTIEKLRSFKTNERSIDINFADRYSFCVINQSKLAKLKKYELKILTQKFYNDTYLVDQNACSSPHLIVWTGKKNKNCQKLFWQELYNLVKEKYILTELAPSEKYNDLCKYLLSLKHISKVNTFDNLIYIIKLKKLPSKNDSFRGKWGLFFEYELDDLNKNMKGFIFREML